MKKIATFIYCMVFTISAFAQNFAVVEDGDSIVKLNEVIVIAYKGMPKNNYNVSKINVPIKYLPISTNDVSGKLLDIMGITELREAAALLPGVRVYTSYGAFQQISIRGFGQQVIMLDGIRDERAVHSSSSYPFPDMSSVESIELLKGPASVLYGSGAVGGVINIVRKAPIATTNLDARISYGSFDTRSVRFGFGGKLSGPVNYRLNFYMMDQDGWRNLGNKKLSGYFAIASKVGRNGYIEIRGGMNRDFYGTETGLPSNMLYDIYSTDGSVFLKKGEQLKGLDRSLRYNNESDFMHHNNYNVSIQYKHKISEHVNLFDKISYSYDDIDYFGTEELSYLDSDLPIYKNYYMIGKNKKYICLDTVMLSFPLRFSHIANTFNNQLELNGCFNTGNIKHNYLAGFSTVVLLRNSFSGYNLGTDVKGPGLYSHVSVMKPHSMGYMETSFGKVTPQRRFMYGLYLHDLIELSDKIKLMLAGRYDFFDYRSASGIKTIDGKRKFNMPLSSDFDKVITSAFSYRTGIVYLPNTNLQLFTSIGSFFKANTNFYSDREIYVDIHGKEFSAENGDRVFRPESGYQIEIGSKYTMLNRMSIGANLFYIKKKNIVGLLRNKGDILDDGTVLEKNVRGQFGSMDSKGFDIDVTYRVMDNMFLGAGYAFTDAKNRDVKKNKYLLESDVNGKPFVHIPKNTFYSYLNYSFVKGFFKGLNVNVSANYMDKIYYSVASNQKTPSYWLIDGALSYMIFNNLKLELNVNNIFNKEYFTEPAVSWQLIPGMPRNYKFSIAYSF